MWLNVYVWDYLCFILSDSDSLGVDCVNSGFIYYLIV